MTTPRRSGQLRPHEFDDREFVLDLSIAAWAPIFESIESELGPDLFGRIYPDWPTQQRDAVGEALDTNETWVSEEDGDVVGFVNVIFDPEKGSGEIHMMAVDPDAQREGIAGELTEFALAEMQRRGITLATVGTGADPGHAPARRVYEQAGFTPFPQVWYSKLLTSPDEDE